MLVIALKDRGFHRFIGEQSYGRTNQMTAPTTSCQSPSLYRLQSLWWPATGLALGSTAVGVEGLRDE